MLAKDYKNVYVIDCSDWKLEMWYKKTHWKKQLVKLTYT